MKQTLLRHAQEYAQRIDAFLIQREKSVLSKLIAISKATEEESFEVQAKVRIADPAPVLEAIQQPEVEILRYRHYHEFDYLLPVLTIQNRASCATVKTNLSRIRHISQVRYRLTLIGQAREHQFPSEVSCLAAATWRRPPTACAFTASISSRPANSRLKKTASAGGFYSRAPSFMSTWTGWTNRPWVISWRSKAAPGAAKMRSIRQMSLSTCCNSWAHQPKPHIHKTIWS